MIAEYKRILIPQEQMQQQLREFCQFFITEDKSKNKAMNTKRYAKKGYALIRNLNIGISHLILDNVHRVSKDIYDKRNVRAIPQPNDIIYAKEAPAGNLKTL